MKKIDINYQKNKMKNILIINNYLDHMLNWKTS